MAEKVLVAYASKYGATAQIAENIALRLKKAGLDAEAKDVKEVKDIRNYSAVLLGSGVYAGNWLKKAADFLKKNQDELAKRPVWLFSGGPTGGGNPVEMMKGWRFPDALKPIADKVKPRDIAFFHGVLEINKLRFAEKMIIRALKAPLGDFRDWEMINNWADGVAKALKTNPGFGELENRR